MEQTAEEIADLTTRLCTLSFLADMEECKTIEDFERLREHYRQRVEDAKSE